MSRGAANRIYIYNTRSPKEGARVLVEGIEQKLALASDGQSVVWVERLINRTYRIRHYNLSTSQLSTVVQGATEEENFGAFAPNAAQPFPSRLAVGGGILYYRSTGPGHKGLWARTLETGEERLISPDGQSPAASGNSFIWYDSTRVHLSIARNLNDDVILFDFRSGAGGSFTGYGISNGNVVWHTRAMGIHLYSSSKQTDTNLTPSSNNSPLIYHPLINGNTVVWTEEAQYPGYKATWFIKRYNLAKGTTAVVTSGENLQPLEAWAMPDERTVAFRIGNNIGLIDLP
jgi:hypothetical protein